MEDKSEKDKTRIRKTMWRWIRRSRRKGRSWKRRIIRKRNGR